MRWIATLLLLLGTPASGAELTASIEGPAEVVPGDLVILRSTGMGATNYHWSILPAIAKSRFYAFTERDADGAIIGSTAIFASRVSGTYYFVLSVSDAAGGLAVATHTLTNGAPAPPEPEPGPDPEPEPDNDWTAWVKERVERVIPQNGRRETAAALADSIDAVCAAAAAGTYTNSRDLRVAIKQGSIEALGTKRAEIWDDKFDDAYLVPLLKELIASGELDTLEEYVDVYKAIAKGLRAVR